MDAPTKATMWEARPAPGLLAPPGVAPIGTVRWGVVYLPTGRWVVYGSEARCRRLAAQLAEADAILARPSADRA
jgi:hypothetical protein